MNDRDLKLHLLGIFQSVSQAQAAYAWVMEGYVKKALDEPAVAKLEALHMDEWCDVRPGAA